MHGTWTRYARSWRGSVTRGDNLGPSTVGHDEHHLWLLAAACVVATVAFWAYTRTLLPGVDLGDTGGIQAAVLWPEHSARRAYPLYYALAKPFIRAVSEDNPARGLNLFSAIWAAVVAGLLTIVGGRLTMSPLAGAASGLLLAFSFTFWTQAIIAQVYSLHLALLAGCLLALQSFAARPTTGRLAVFFAVYAAAFGNHLGMILFLIPFTVLVLQSHPRPQTLFRRSTVGLALVIVIAGALQYTPAFLYVWSSIDAPRAWADRVAAFWLDVTKADWREGTVLGVSSSQWWGRLQMWAWDARQQFGDVGMLLAVLGVVRVWSLSRPWAVFLGLAYAITTLFALTYNSGDAYVFLLPGHLLIALVIAVGLTHWRDVRLRYALTAIALVYASWRGWDTWPAVDRHDDRRAEAQLAHLAEGVDARSALLVSKMDWQVENVLLYASRYTRRDLAWVRLDDVLPHFPFLVKDNVSAARHVVLTADAARSVVAAYAAEFPLVLDQDPAPGLADIAARMPPGTPYVLTLLSPAPAGRTLDRGDFAKGLAELTGNRVPSRVESAYEVWAGSHGEAPTLYRSEAHPFTTTVLVGGEPFTIRMDSWLPDDTFRRGGFAHVLHGREHALIAERGISLVWLQRDGSPATYYGAGLYTPEPRYRILAPAAHLAKNQ